ncbi:MAG TPA: cobalt transport protein CbiN [Blastocatellia bacterium]|nr:cobalt transport protein CbiN [Blastocatellia bacterium]
MKRREKIILIILLVVFASPFVMKRLGRMDGFVGTDNQAQDMIGRIQPGYRPWFNSIFVPGEKEEWLFALQAAIGVGVFSYCLIKLHARRKTGDRSQRK